jgi:phage terminase small subunit
MAGRPRKPHNVKVLEGTFRKDRENTSAPRPNPGIPEAPEWMLPEAQREWGRVIAEMENLGIITKLDRSMLAAYCQMWARWVEAEKVNEPLPASHMAQMRYLAASFGLDPAAREKLNAKPKEPEKKNKYVRNG